MTTAERVAPRLKQRYRDEIRDGLQEQFGYGNVMQIPGVVKVVVNMGVGDAARDAKLIDGAVRDLATITGQKPQVRRATKSIAQFKLREGMPIGAKVTLRGDRMWEFLDRLLTIALPRIRDFRGLSPTQFDGRGNYTFGLTEQSMFHEIDQDRIDRVRGMDITVVTTATNDDEGRALLKQLGFPFKENWHGQDRTGQQGEPEAEVQGPRVHPLPEVRSPALGVPQVRPLPHLPSRDGARGRAAGRDQELLVVGSSSPEQFLDQHTSDTVGRPHGIRRLAAFEQLPKVETPVRKGGEPT